MLLRKKLFLTVSFCAIIASTSAQRVYAPNSILASGNFYKIGVKEAGVYKIDIPFLNNMGVATSNLPSSNLRLYGNGGKMLEDPLRQPFAGHPAGHRSVPHSASSSTGPTVEMAGYTSLAVTGI